MATVKVQTYKCIKYPALAHLRCIARPEARVTCTHTACKAWQVPQAWCGAGGGDSAAHTGTWAPRC